MDKAIITVFLIVAGVIAAVLVFNAAYPAVVQSNSDMASMQARIDERLRSEIEVIHIAKSPDYADVALAWVKNIGTSTIKAIDRCDVFFGPEGAFQRIPYGSGDPHWEYTVENGSTWGPASTLRVTVDLDYVLSPGERYYFKIATPNGISADDYFSPGR